MASSSIMSEPFPSESMETSTGGRVVVAFAGNTKYVVGGGKLNGVLEVRRAADGQQMASIEAEGVLHLAGSRDGKWIAAGTVKRELLMWNAETYERVFEHKEPFINAITAIDFSPDSTRLISVFLNRKTTVWDVATRIQMQTLIKPRPYPYDLFLGLLVSAKYSPQGDRIAIATKNCLRVYDGNSGHLLVDTKVRVGQSHNNPLWFGQYLFIISNSTIKQLDTTDGSVVSEWQIPYSEKSCIALLQSGKVIAYSAKHTVTFWDTSTHTKCGLIERPLQISCIASSPDDRFLAIGGFDGEVTIQSLKDGFPLCNSAVPCIHRASAAFDSWKPDCPDAGSSLTGAISTSQHESNREPANRFLVRVLMKRSKVYIADGLWELALNDANKVIELDPSSPWGYERKHAALHKAGDYENAVNAFEAMLSKMSQSSDPDIRKLHHQYISPTMARATIRCVVRDFIRDSPRVLINTISGQLFDKSEQASAFESLPVFSELISSMTAIIDHARIEHDVTQYYRYAMFSHEREDNEPLFENVIRVIVYDLKDSPTTNKLKMFCEIVRDAGLHWAWSDTCCVNRDDDFVFQEALVAMFRWYQGSALTLVLLCGVRSPSRYGDLIRSIWNTRAWTFQEYYASKVVRFYNDDWTLYRNIDISNHKESPEILSEMEEARGILARALMALQPGLDNITEKLRLVSSRETTLVEDEVYSLLGIFAASLPVASGVGDQALGRLLAQILMSSGDARILAWTGKSGSFNSCLPGTIRAFNHLASSHVPPSMTDTEMVTITAMLRSSSVSLDLVMKFYHRLQELPGPWFFGQWLELPCLVFNLEPLSVSPTRSEQVFHARTTALGMIEIKSEEDLSQLESLILVHPWIGFLLDRQSVEETTPKEEADDRSSSASEPSSPPPQSDKHTAALQLFARLRQPFGALLLTPTRQDSVAGYRRVASESLVTVQVQQDIPLDSLIASVRILNVF